MHSHAHAVRVAAADRDRGPVARLEPEATSCVMSREQTSSSIAPIASRPRSTDGALGPVVASIVVERRRRGVERGLAGGVAGLDRAGEGGEVERGAVVADMVASCGAGKGTPTTIPRPPSSHRQAARQSGAASTAAGVDSARAAGPRARVPDGRARRRRSRAARGRQGPRPARLARAPPRPAAARGRRRPPLARRARRERPRQPPHRGLGAPQGARRRRGALRTTRDDLELVADWVDQRRLRHGRRP